MNPTNTTSIKIDPYSSSTGAGGNSSQGNGGTRGGGGGLKGGSFGGTDGDAGSVGKLYLFIK